MVARAGDIVSRRKGLVMHKGVALGDGRVLHNTPFKGEHICSEREFRDGRRMYVDRNTDINRRRLMRQIREDRIREERTSRGRIPTQWEGDSGRGYNLLTNNCEHTVSRVTTGKSESPQLRSWVLGTGLAAATFVLTRHPVATAAAYALGRKYGARLGR